MTLAAIYSIVKEYLKSPFIIFGIFVFLITISNCTPEISNFIHQLWVTSLYWYVLGALLSITLYREMKLVRHPNVISIMKEKPVILFSIVMSLAMFLGLEIPFYLISIIDIMKHDANLSTTSAYPYWIFVASLLGYFIIPFFKETWTYFLKNPDKRTILSKKIKSFFSGNGHSKYNSTYEKSTISSQSEIIDYYPDKSLNSKSQDKFMHKHYAQVLEDILVHSETPINVGLFGRWGVGKSSILHMLREEIESGELSKKFRYLEIDAWGLSGTSLKQDVLVAINDNLKAYSIFEIENMLYNEHEETIVSIKDSKKRIFGLVIVFITSIIIGYAVLNSQNWITFENFLKIIGISTLLTVLTPIINYVIRPSKTTIPKQESAYQFSRIYQKMVDSVKKKLVVVIDNLDRCDDEIAVELLGLIQTFMTKDDCINILACDDEAIVNHLQRVKGNSYTEREGNEFLSKFFQVTIRIPPFIPENLESYVTGLMEKRHIPFHPSVKAVLISGAVKNPRKVNQFLNNLVALYRLAKFKEEHIIPQNSITKRTDFLTKIIILHHEWPKFYNELDKTEDPQLLDSNSNQFADWFKRITGSEDTNEYDELQYDGLTDFLADTRYCTVEDIKLFLRLNRPSYESEIQDIEKFDIDVRRNRSESILEALNQVDDQGKDNYIKRICAINEKNETEASDIALLNSTQSLITSCKVITKSSTREDALRNLGRCLSSNLMKEHLMKYDVNELFPLIKEMPEYYSKILYKKFIKLIEAGDTVNENIIIRFLDNNTEIPVSTLKEFDSSITDMITKHEERILDIVMKNCNSTNWTGNKFDKPIQFITSFTNNITFDDTPLDNKRIETYLTIQSFADVSEKENFIKHLQDIVDANSSTSLPTRVLEILNNLADTSILDLNTIIISNLFNSLLNASSNIVDIDQKKQIFEILFKLAYSIGADTK